MVEPGANGRGVLRRATGPGDTAPYISEFCGGYGWGIIHHAAETFPCPSCAKEGRSLMRFAHDLVNFQLGKPIHYPETLAYWKGVAARADREGVKVKAELGRDGPGRRVTKSLRQTVPQGDYPKAYYEVAIEAAPHLSDDDLAYQIKHSKKYLRVYKKGSVLDPTGEKFAGGRTIHEMALTIVRAEQAIRAGKLTKGKAAPRPIYSKEAVEKEISKDPRIKPAESKAIHRLLKGRARLGDHLPLGSIPRGGNHIMTRYQARHTAGPRSQSCSGSITSHARQSQGGDAIDPTYLAQLWIGNTEWAYNIVRAYATGSLPEGPVGDKWGRMGPADNIKNWMFDTVLGEGALIEGDAWGFTTDLVQNALARIDYLELVEIFGEE